MRLLVSRLCGSINACAPRARSVAAADRQSHTFSELRTLGRAPLLSFASVRGVLVFYEARGRLFIYTTDEILLRRYRGSRQTFHGFPRAMNGAAARIFFSREVYRDALAF